MKKYADPDNQRYVYYIRETLNGYAIQVLNVDRDERYPLTPAVAALIGIALPDTPLAQSCARSTAERYLKRMAEMNGLVGIE